MIGKPLQEAVYERSRTGSTIKCVGVAAWLFWLVHTRQCGFLQHLTAPVRASARRSFPGLKPKIFPPFLCREAGQANGQAKSYYAREVILEKSRTWKTHILASRSWSAFARVRRRSRARKKCGVTWKIEYPARVRKTVRKQDRQVQCRIRDFLDSDRQKRKIPGYPAPRRAGRATAISGGTVSATAGSATGIFAS